MESTTNTVNLDNYYDFASRTEKVPTEPVHLTVDVMAIAEQLFEKAVALGKLVDSLKRYLVYGDRKQSLANLTCFSGLAHSLKENGRALLTSDGLDISLEHFRLLHAAMGKFTEAGELIEAVMPLLLKPQGEFDKVNIMEEVGDSNWYDAILADICGFTQQQMLQANIDKLKVRYSDKFTEHAALNRDLVKEAESLKAARLFSEDRLHDISGG